MTEPVPTQCGSREATTSASASPLEADEAATAPDAVRFAIIDGLYHGPETWESDVAGFSAPIIVQALRESRRLCDRLSPGHLIRFCMKHREQFRSLNANIDDLMETRYACEKELEARGVLKLTYDHDDEDCHSNEEGAADERS